MLVSPLFAAIASVVPPRVMFAGNVGVTVERFVDGAAVELRVYVSGPFAVPVMVYVISIVAPPGDVSDAVRVGVDGTSVTVTVALADTGVCGLSPASL